ncbi:hypothetical protein N7G274_002793 [Stereocaulon virgatum]|uniref:Amino acid transporter transmembrane domain-containing protein n=1 Tax=Stereocaulon virgatum TaxID=373712 RepID=A0ABR4AIU5_9LECA
MAGQRMLQGCIRLSSVLLLALLGFHGIDLYNAVVVLEVFQLMPHGHQFLKGLQIMGQVGIVYYIWSMIVMLPACFANGLALVLIGLGDLALALPLLFGVIYQSEYLPHSRSDCQYAATWKNASGNSNFFQVASNISFFATTPQVVCQDCFRFWVVGISIM